MKKMNCFIAGMGKRVIFIAIFLQAIISLQAQCFISNTAVGPGEYLAYDVSYQVGPAWTNIASLTFSTVQEMQNGKQVLHMKLNGKTYPTYDHIFKVRDSYESWINIQNWEPLKFQRYTLHDENTVLLTQFFYPAQSFFMYNLKVNNDAVSKGQLPLPKCLNDMVSSI